MMIFYIKGITQNLRVFARVEGLSDA